tara:strand:+ start:68027 stop:68809 length:783 start_codon:yes stop_codon:yes gene_type:complete
MENLSEEEKAVRDLLEVKVQEFNAKSFISSDPIQISHRFENPKDIEITALLMATIAWGNRTMIIKNGERLLNIMQHEPYEFVSNYSTDSLKDIKFVHRTFNLVDLDFFFRSLQRIYQEQGSLEKAFDKHPEIPGVKGRIVSFRDIMLQTDHEKRSEKHISNPLRNSAAKRINMFLRWMVRNDNNRVDFGIWNSIPTSELMLPLDVHTGRVARKLGLLHRKQDDWKALEELMSNLKRFDSKDPVKYDYALFGLGAFDGFAK